MSRRPAPARRAVRGFTLIELMVVIVILGLLIGLVGKNVWQALKKGSADTAEMQMSQIADAINSYKVQKRSLPRTLEELTQEDEQTKEPFMEKIPSDPWGQPYDYKITDDRRMKFEIVCAGEDKQPGTDDDLYYPKRDSPTR